MIILIFHLIVSYGQTISLFFMWKMDPMSCFDIHLVFTLPRQYIAVRKMRTPLKQLSLPEIRELQRSTNIYNMRYFPQHVLFCTSTVHDQDICIQGYLRILWIGNAISLKIDNIHKRYVLCLKLEDFLKSWKTKPLNATIGREMSVKNNTWNHVAWRAMTL